MFRQFMQANQTMQLNIAAEFFYIEQCPSEIMLRTERGEYRLSKGAQIIDKAMGDRITIQNLGDAGSVSLVWGFGQYVPPVDGQKTVIQSMPAVDVQSLPAVSVEVLPSVVIESMPSVEVSALSPVTVETMPAVKLAEGQKVETTQTLADTFTASAEALPFTLAANPNRKKVFIKAPTENTDGVLIGGAFELEQGEWLEMENTAEIAFTGADGDSVQLLEY